MKKLFFYLTYMLALAATLPANADNVPWQNPQINEINREAMHAHFIPFINEDAALAQQALPDLQRFEINSKTGNDTFHLTALGNFFSPRITILVLPIFINRDTAHANGKT